MSEPQAPGPAIRIAQLSDTHFIEDGAEPEGTFAYDTSAAFAAIASELASQGPFDLVAVTGDVADHGRHAQYRRAAEAFASLEAPVNVCPGNHDQDAVFTTALGRPTVGTSRAIEIGTWCFLFADSNAGAMVESDDGRMIDPAEYEDRLHGNGALGHREASWLKEMCATTEADHVFIWIHHPPEAPVGLTADLTYDAEWRAIMPDLAKLRGIGAGHTHVPDDYTFAGVPVFVSPSLKNNFDLQAETTLPPGCRTYTFAHDGTITSDVTLTDAPQWPRHPLGRSVVALMRGELSWDDFHAIVARKSAQ